LKEDFQDNAHLPKIAAYLRLHDGSGGVAGGRGRIMPLAVSAPNPYYMYVFSRGFRRNGADFSAIYYVILV